jgi:hypothetical protein
VKLHTRSDGATATNVRDRFGVDDYAVLIDDAASAISKVFATTCADRAELTLVDVDIEILEAIAADLDCFGADHEAEAPIWSPPL